MDKKKPKKPTGVTGPVRLSGAGSEFLPLQFPSTKEGIEDFIAEGFVRSARATGADISLGPHMETDDLDFSAVLAGQEVYLELTEVAPLGKGGYGAAASSYRVYDFAESVSSQIRKKARRYKGVKKPIMLLLYTTDWKFIPSQSSLELVEFWMREGRHGFTRIDWYCSIMHEEGVLFELYPSQREDWSGFEPSRLRGRVVHNMDLRPE